MNKALPKRVELPLPAVAQAGRMTKWDLDAKLAAWNAERRCFA